jgi:Rrf2 family transcriptional regulator, iron-sulfur cluster assembly transcription factor
MSLLSKSCVYGLRASLYVAGFAGERTFVPINEIARELDISFHFLTKIFQQLTGAGLLESYRGPSGGVKLAKPASEIVLLDIVKAIDGDGLFSECVLGLEGCGTHAPCPLHATWAAQRGKLHDALEGATLESLRDPVKAAELRLHDRDNDKKPRAKRAK